MCLFCSLDIKLMFSIAAMEITNIKASFFHPSKSLLAYFEIPKEYLEKYLSTKKCQSQCSASKLKYRKKLYLPHLQVRTTLNHNRFPCSTLLTALVTSKHSCQCELTRACSAAEDKNTACFHFCSQYILSCK